ncbi:MAG: 1,4-dihydroxy-2-naphthoate octaprenyltransferase [Verrucomicrobia bacterium]|nr:1,4-dihydroxy-2-naphthoate octaprenyltransferase [Verrucomicrobiota bacterium]
MSSLRAWVSAARPKTLVAAVAPVALGGAVVVARAGVPGLWAAPGFVFFILSCLGFALCVQVACNFANDLGDSLRGADTAARVGPRRAVSAGDIAPDAMRRGIWIACLLALVLGAPVASLSPWLLLAGFLAIGCALAYTLGPFPLAYRGLGDVFVIACFGVQATVLTAWALCSPGQGPGDCSCDALAMPWFAALIAGLGLGLLADNILVANNARDYETDLAVGKRTTVVRFGRGFARNLHGFNSVFGLVCLGCVFGWVPLVLLPWALWQHLAFRRASAPQDFLPLLGRAAVLMLLATALCVTATCLGWAPAGTLNL